MALTFRAIVLIVIGLVVGSLVRPVLAQPDSFIFQVGQRMTLQWKDRSVDCTVREIRGTFVRCVEPQPDPFMRVPPYINWYNTAVLESVYVREK